MIALLHMAPALVLFGFGAAVYAAGMLLGHNEPGVRVCVGGFVVMSAGCLWIFALVS